VIESRNTFDQKWARDPVQLVEWGPIAEHHKKPAAPCFRNIVNEANAVLDFHGV
jgi:hypothetical protein